MARKKVDLKKCFPNKKDVQKVLQTIEATMGAGLFQLTDVAWGAMESAFRFSVLSKCLKLARQRHRVSIASAARSLGAPTAKLAELEEAAPPDAGLLLRYVYYLGLEKYYLAWRSVNPELALVIELEAIDAGVLARGKKRSAAALGRFPGFRASVLPPSLLPEIVDLKLPPVFSPPELFKARHAGPLPTPAPGVGPNLRRKLERTSRKPWTN